MIDNGTMCLCNSNYQCRKCWTQRNLHHLEKTRNELIHTGAVVIWLRRLTGYPEPKS